MIIYLRKWKDIIHLPDNGLWKIKVREVNSRYDVVLEFRNKRFLLKSCEKYEVAVSWIRDILDMICRNMGVIKV